MSKTSKTSQTSKDEQNAIALFEKIIQWPTTVAITLYLPTAFSPMSTKLLYVAAVGAPWFYFRDEIPLLKTAAAFLGSGALLQLASQIVQ